MNAASGLAAKALTPCLYSACQFARLHLRHHAISLHYFYLIIRLYARFIVSCLLSQNYYIVFQCGFCQILNAFMRK